MKKMERENEENQWRQMQDNVVFYNIKDDQGETQTKLTDTLQKVMINDTLKQT